MSDVYLYVVARDFGFAPNPFHGYCTLATCKPLIRKGAKVGDWIVGIGGGRIKASGKCIFAMRVSEKINFTEYWQNPRYRDKKPIRNGSNKMMVGDNIYHRDPQNRWHQADSHHSLADGSTNFANLEHDTATDGVLISNHFFYFGNAAPTVPVEIFQHLRYTNGRGHRRFSVEKCSELLEWLYKKYGKSLNIVQGDPFDFNEGDRRYSVHNDKVT